MFTVLKQLCEKVLIEKLALSGFQTYKLATVLLQLQTALLFCGLTEQFNTIFGNHYSSLKAKEGRGPLVVNWPNGQHSLTETN